MYQYRAKLKRIIDGDSIEAILDHGLGVYRVDKFRLADIDAPERFTKEGVAATLWLTQELKTIADKGRDHHGHIFIRTEKQGKYGRYLAHIYLDETFTGDTVNTRMRKAGHAVFYNGGKRG